MIYFMFSQSNGLGNGEFISFSASVTPNPYIHLFEESMTFWLGGSLSFTETMRHFVTNMTLEKFINELRFQYFIDYGIDHRIIEYVKNMIFFLLLRYK